MCGQESISLPPSPILCLDCDKLTEEIPTISPKKKRDSSSKSNRNEAVPRSHASLNSIARLFVCLRVRLSVSDHAYYREYALAQEGLALRSGDNGGVADEWSASKVTFRRGSASRLSSQTDKSKSKSKPLPKKREEGPLQICHHLPRPVALSRRRGVLREALGGEASQPQPRFEAGSHLHQMTKTKASCFRFSLSMLSERHR